MSRFAGVAGVLFVLLAIIAFAHLNGGERVTLDLGLTTFYRVPLNVIAFGGVFVGMLVMLVAGIHSDLKVRKFLRERLRDEGAEERSRVIDRAQQDLFTTVHDYGRDEAGARVKVAAPAPPVVVDDRRRQIEAFLKDKPAPRAPFGSDPGSAPREGTPASSDGSGPSPAAPTPAASSSAFDIRAEDRPPQAAHEHEKREDPDAKRDLRMEPD